MPENVLNGDHIDVKGTNCEPRDNDDESTENDVHFEPIISLPLIEVSSNEEEETEMLKLRAKLYRYDTSSNPAEWKERGTGEVKLLRHKTKNTVRVVMRRDKTLKICANHFITPWMELKPNCGSDRAWVWSVLADYADEQLKPELLAIRFANTENASVWKEAFEKAKKIVGSECEIYAGKSNSEQKRVESDSESSSDVSYSESTDNEDQTKSFKRTEDCDAISQQKDIEKETTDKKEVLTNEEKIFNEIAKLKVKNEALRQIRIILIAKILHAYRSYQEILRILGIGRYGRVLLVLATIWKCDIEFNEHYLELGDNLVERIRIQGYTSFAIIANGNVRSNDDEYEYDTRSNHDDKNCDVCAITRFLFVSTN